MILRRLVLRIVVVRVCGCLILNRRWFLILWVFLGLSVLVGFPCLVIRLRRLRMIMIRKLGMVILVGLRLLTLSKGRRLLILMVVRLLLVLASLILLRWFTWL